MKKIHILVFAAFVLTSSCKDYDEKVLDPDKVVTAIIIRPNQIEADGESQAIVEVSFPIELATDKAKIDIRTSSGSFRESGKDLVSVNGNVERQADGTFVRIGRATLISPNVEGNAVITAQVAGYSRTNIITFNQAYADSMIIETDKLALKKGPENTATITVTLMRNRGRGKPAMNSKVMMTLKDLQGNNHGLIAPASNQTAADGKCKFVIGRGMDTYTGPIIIKAINPQLAEPLIKSTQILFTD